MSSQPFHDPPSRARTLHLARSVAGDTRRRFARVLTNPDARLRAVLERRESGETWKRQVRDLSVSGCAVDLGLFGRRNLRPGDRLEIRLLFPDAPEVTLLCQIRHVTWCGGAVFGTWVAGILFLDCPALLEASRSIVSYQSRCGARMAERGGLALARSRAA